MSYYTIFRIKNGAYMIIMKIRKLTFAIFYYPIDISFRYWNLIVLINSISRKVEVNIIRQNIHFMEIA